MQQPVFYLSHGGGPWPWMQAYLGNMYARLEASLKAIPASLPAKPSAILLVTAHWEADPIAISTAAHPGMVYDYYGFPAETYDVTYPAPGNPTLAAHIDDLLQAKGIAAQFDATRGYDHGSFVPLAVLYPEADIPVVQMSIHHNLDAEMHLALGEALAPLRAENVLILASGMSFHNMRAFNVSGSEPSAAFDDWLFDVVTQQQGEARAQHLINWDSEAPFARFAQPREDHLIPLMVAVGAAQTGKALRIYHDTQIFGGIHTSSFRFD